MATVLVKNLPAVTEVDADDLLIVNVGGSGEFTTSNITFSDFKSTLSSGGQTFVGDVEVNGNVTIVDPSGNSSFVGNLDGNITGTAEFVNDLTGHNTSEISEAPGGPYYLQAAERQAIVDNTQGLADLVLEVGQLRNDTTDGFQQVGVKFGPNFHENYSVSNAVDILGEQITTLDTTVGTIGGQVNDLDTTVTSLGGQVGSFDPTTKGTIAVRLDALESDTTAADALAAANAAQSSADDAGTVASNALQTANDNITNITTNAGAAADAATAAANAQSTADGNTAGAALGATALQPAAADAAYAPIATKNKLDALATAVNDPTAFADVEALATAIKDALA